MARSLRKHKGKGNYKNKGARDQIHRPSIVQQCIAIRQVSKQASKATQREDLRDGDNDYREEARKITARKQSEHMFFEQFFRNDPKLLEEYQKELSKNPDGFIEWIFLPRIDGRQHKGAQYRRALYYIRDRITGIQHLNTMNDLNDLNDQKKLNVLKDLTEKVILEREREIASHQTVCRLWEDIRDTIVEKQHEINFLDTRVPNNSRIPKVDQDKSTSNRNFFLRLLFCCCS